MHIDEGQRQELTFPHSLIVLLDRACTFDRERGPARPPSEGAAFPETGKRAATPEVRPTLNCVAVPSGRGHCTLLGVVRQLVRELVG